MRKFFVFACFLLISTCAIAQNGYRVEIKQVFPSSKLVYSNVFNFKRELDNAIENQTAKLNGSCNYQILVTTPSGKETRNIQNINLVQVVNGVKTYHRKKTTPEPYYSEPTIWKGYACNMDGTIKGGQDEFEYLYRVAMAEEQDVFLTDFVDLKTALLEASGLLDEKNTKEKLVEVVVFKFENKEVLEFERFSNKEEYDANLAKLNKDAELQAEKQANEKQLLIEEKMERFRNDMLFVHAHRDSLKIIGLDYCCNALDSAMAIPKDQFLSQMLDSLYLSTVFDDVFPEKDKKVKKIKKKIGPELDALKNAKGNSPSILLKQSKEVADALSKIDKKKSKMK